MTGDGDVPSPLSGGLRSTRRGAGISRECELGVQKLAIDGRHSEGSPSYQLDCWRWHHAFDCMCLTPPLPVVASEHVF